MLKAEMLIYMPDLRTPRLRLRKLTMRDAADIYRYSRDPEVARHVLWDAHRSIGDSRAYLRYMLRRYRSHEPASWGIELMETGQIIGTIGFMWVQEDNAAAEVGYSLSRDHWGKGYMTEALRAVIQYGFDVIGLHKVQICVRPSNTPSRKVIEKCGFVYEGNLRDYFLMPDGTFEDRMYFSILKSEFKKTEEKNRV